MPLNNTAESIFAHDNANVHVGNNYHTFYYGDNGLGESNPELKRLRILQQLYQAPGIEVACPIDYESYKARNPTRTAGSCEWLLQSEQYTKWRHAPTSSFLWLTADAGCGKSVLSSTVVDELRRSENARLILHFFFRDDDETQNSGISALRALLHQVLMACETIPPTVAAEYDCKGEAAFSSIRDLWRLLVSAVSEGGKDVFCILDGLDECERVTQSVLAKAINKLYEGDVTLNNTNEPENSPFLKMFVTARCLNSITTKLHKLSHCRMRGEDQSQSIGADIQPVLEREINELFEGGLIERDTAALIHLKLSQQENHTYLWISRVTQKLREHAEDGASEAELLNLLDDNSIIYPVYATYLDKCTQKQSTHDVVLRKTFFQILLAAVRPLTLIEMDYALSICAEHKHSRDIHPNLHPARENFLRRLGGSLVTFRGQVVSFIHQSVRDFLLASPADSISPGSTETSFGRWYHSIDLREAHHILAQRCEWYLLLSDLSTPATATGPSHQDREASYTKVAEQHPFLCYASRHRHRHEGMGSSAENDDDLGDLASRISSTSDGGS